MHRILIFFFSLWYLLLSGGVVASLHMCQGMVQEVAIFGSQEEEEGAHCHRCSTENEPHRDGCCDYSVDIVNPTDKVPEFSKKHFTFKLVNAALPANFTAFANFSGTSLKETQTYNKELLLRPVPGFPLHKLHCIYRI